MKRDHAQPIVDGSGARGSGAEETDAGAVLPIPREIANRATSAATTAKAAPNANPRVYPATKACANPAWGLLASTLAVCEVAMVDRSASPTAPPTCCEVFTSAEAPQTDDHGDDPVAIGGDQGVEDCDHAPPGDCQPAGADNSSFGALDSLLHVPRVEGMQCCDQNPSDSFSKIAVIRPEAIALLMTRMLFTPLATP